MVCHLKNKGGLGLKDVRVVNLRWRLIFALKDVLIEKYGPNTRCLVDGV